MLDFEFFQFIPNTTVFFERVVIEPALVENKDIRLIGKKGSGMDDWSMYYGPSSDNPNRIIHYGTKVGDRELVRKLLPCSDEVLNLYRL